MTASVIQYLYHISVLCLCKFIIASGRCEVSLSRRGKRDDASVVSKPQNRSVGQFSHTFIISKGPAEAQTPFIRRTLCIVLSGQGKITADVSDRGIGLFHVEIAGIQVHRLIAELTVLRSA